MTSNSVSIPWLLPFMTLAPIGLAHCIESTERQESTEMEEPADGGQMKAPLDGGQMKAPPDGGQMKAPPDGGQKTAGDSGTKGDASSKQPPDGAAPTGDDAGPATPPDAGAPHDAGSVPCNGAPCDVRHGYFCCVTWTSHGTTEACNPSHSACWGHTIACDEEADCDNAVCCQDFPSGGLAGSASCKASCDAHICR
jgi:hypothetical protein